jgi:hypothetical protein
MQRSFNNFSKPVILTEGIISERSQKDVVYKIGWKRELFLDIAKRNGNPLFICLYFSIKTTYSLVWQCAYAF